jgi:hypothetical protein
MSSGSLSDASFNICSVQTIQKQSRFLQRKAFLLVFLRATENWQYLQERRWRYGHAKELGKRGWQKEE